LLAWYAKTIVSMTRTGNCSTSVELARYVEWILDSAQAEEELEIRFAVPVSRGIAARIRLSVLERMTCDGRLVMDLVRRQKHDEHD